MYKKVLLLAIALLSISIWLANNNIWEDETKTIYSQNENKIINTEWLDDPLSNGTTDSARWLQWIAKIDISSKENKQKWFVKYISIWVNYFLWILSFIVITLIIKDGYAIITAWWNENKKKEAFINIKNYILALVFIWTWYLVINMVFYIVNKSTKDISYNPNIIYKI